MNNLVTEAYKSIPHSASVAATGPVTLVGVAAAAGLFPVAVDFEDRDVSAYHEGLVAVEVFSINGQGATPTSPGAAATFTVKVAFSTFAEVLATDAPTVLGDSAQSFEVTLPDTASSGAAGRRINVFDPFVVRGRYLYLWLDKGSFASADASVEIFYGLIRV